jgi:hypothetical protein
MSTGCAHSPAAGMAACSDRADWYSIRHDPTGRIARLPTGLLATLALAGAESTPLPLNLGQSVPLKHQPSPNL